MRTILSTMINWILYEGIILIAGFIAGIAFSIWAFGIQLWTIR